MNIDEKLKNKITFRYLKSLGIAMSFIMEDVRKDLFKRNFDVNITTRGKFTIAEIKYNHDGYVHHFLGISAKNPKDIADTNRGIKVALEDALMKLIIKFYSE